MPIRKRWSRFNLENVLELEDEPGVYGLANRGGRIIDTGGSDSSVRDRLLSHLRNNKYPTAVYFRCQYAGFFDSGIQMEAIHAEKFRRKYGRKPRYTKRSPRRYSFLGFQTILISPSRVTRTCLNFRSS